MKVPDWLKLVGAPPKGQMPGGKQLRLLTAREVLEARREALELAAEERELALCSNACLVARGVVRRGRRVYGSGKEVLEKLTAGQIEDLARRWAAFSQEEDLGLGLEKGRLDALKKAWSTCRSSAFGGVCSGVLGRCLQRSGRRL